MDMESFILLLIMLFVAFLMLIIGISQMQSKKPVGFYSGEKAPDANQLSDVFAWNIKHGVMWVIYGIVIIVASLIGVYMINSVWCVIPFVGGVVFPLPVMICYHHKLIKMYKTK